MAQTKKTTKKTAGSTAAKKSSTKKAASTKRAASTKKAPAKKTATGKTTAKSTAKKSSTARKSSSRTSAASAEEAPARPKSKTKFKVNDKVVYPHHGAAVILKKEKNSVDGKKVDYFVLEVATDQLIVRVPVDRAEELGVRPVISKNQARKVFAVFKDEPQEAGSNWSRWYKVLTEKINSGDIFEVAEVVRDLTFAQQTKGISPALKRMLSKALLILNSELRFTLNISDEEAAKRIERALPVVEPQE